MSTKKIAIIGGGAAGLAAAIAAAQQCAQESSSASAEVTIFETADRAGKSILATGNGRCNFSNAHIQAENYHNESFVQNTFEAHSPQHVLDWFSQLGLVWTEESEGRLYPATLKATTVLDVLRMALEELSITVKTGCEVNTVTPVKNQFLLTFEDGITAFFDAVVVAVGKHAARSLLPQEHTFENTTPVLCPLKTETHDIKGLDNIRVRATVKVGGFSEEGEVLFRSYGVSGIVVFNASRFAESGDVLTLDLLPHWSATKLETYINGLHNRYPERYLYQLFAGIVHPRIAEAVGKQAHFEAATQANSKSIKNFVAVLKGFVLTITGKGDIKQAQVLRGGFLVEGFNPATLESLIVPGLFATGEALDVDGPCGGYNLHWAWTSGILAGRNAAQHSANHRG